MDNLFIPDFNEYLEKADECLSKRKHFTEYELLIESCISEEKAREIEEDDMLLESAGDFIKKAIESVIKAIKSIMESIGDFIDRMTIKGEEKDAFEAFEKACKEDPSLAKKKITVKDYRKIIKAYDEEIEKLEKALKDERMSEDKMNKMVDDATDRLNKLPKAGMVVAATLATDVAIRAAKDNTTIAKAIHLACKSDIGVLNDLLDNLGDKEKAKFEKKIRKATHKSILAKAIAKFRHREERYLLDSVQDTLDQVAKGIPLIPIPVTRMGRIINKNENTKDFAKEIRKLHKDKAIAKIKDKLTPFKSLNVEKSPYSYVTGSKNKEKNSKNVKESVEIRSDIDVSWVDDAIDSLFE